MNEEEYLAYAKEHESVMIEAIRTFHPYYRDFDRHGNISAIEAENLCKILREKIKEETRYSEPVAQYKEYSAEQIMQLANQVWFGMPESYESRSHPAFNIICTLAEGFY